MVTVILIFNHPLIGLVLDQEILGVLSYWNIKAFRDEKRPSQIIEFPLYSDSRITGEIRNLGYSYEVLNLVPYTHDSRLINESLMFRLSWFQSADERFPVETNHSQFHGGWITDELAAIASLRLGVRIKAGSVVRTFGGHCDDELGCPRAARDGIPELRFKHGKPVLPSVVKSVSIERLHGIDELHVLSPEQFVALIRAARQYQEALWVAETEPELAWLMLVSAIETAANEWAIKASNVENLKSAKSELCDSILSQGSEQLLEEISDVFGPTLQSTNKFLKFCLEFMPEAPEDRPVETSKRLKWTKTQLRGVLNKLYEFRSTGCMQASHSQLRFVGLRYLHPEVCRPKLARMG